VGLLNNTVRRKREVMGRDEHLAVALVIYNLVFIDPHDKGYVIEVFAEYFCTEHKEFDRESFIKTCITGRE
jgi:hypothetical protein